MNNRLEYNARKLTLSEDIVQQTDRNYPITKFIGKIEIKISFIMFLMFLFLFVNYCTTGKIFSIDETLDDILMGVGSFAIFILVQIGYDFVKEKEVVDDTLLLIISSIGCVTMMIFYWTVLQCCGVPAFKNVFMTLNFIVVFGVPFIVTWAIVDIIIIVMLLIEFKIIYIKCTKRPNLIQITKCSQWKKDFMTNMVTLRT